jgi:hypothetical protein
MTSALSVFVAEELHRDVPPPVGAFARSIAAECKAAAVLFYGSILRSGDVSGMLDFYVLTDGPHRRGARGWIERRLWPEISFREWGQDGITLRAKVALMPLSTFADAAAGRRLDTTIWTRFVQPAALAWSATTEAETRVVNAVCEAAMTAAAFAVVTGPSRGPADAFWRALFAETYRAELRVERPGREEEIVAFDQARYARLLPLAWNAAGISFADAGTILEPAVSADRRSRLVDAWRRSRRWGRPLNAARLVKSALTIEGAGRYAAWKLERHAGVSLTPWETRHPLLASAAIFWRLRRKRGQADAA